MCSLLFTSIPSIFCLSKYLVTLEIQAEIQARLDLNFPLFFLFDFNQYLNIYSNCITTPQLIPHPRRPTDCLRNQSETSVSRMSYASSESNLNKDRYMDRQTDRDRQTSSRNGLIDTPSCCISKTIFHSHVRQMLEHRDQGTKINSRIRPLSGFRGETCVRIYLM
jgi:hypothetical protein